MGAASPLWNASFPRVAGLLRALEGLAAGAVSDSPRDICRGGAPCPRGRSAGGSAFLHGR